MNQKTVIAVEANIELSRQVLAVCQNMGFDVRVFRDALDALVEAAKSKPDIMVFDAGTPMLGSLDFADAIVRDRQFKSVALIAIVDEADAVALRRYSARGLGVVVTRDDGSMALGKQLSRLLKPYAASVSSGSDRRSADRTKGAA